jgi:hypothetical protein
MDERLVLLVAYDGAELLDIANRIGATPPYRMVLATPRRRAVRCDSGLQLQANDALDRRATVAVPPYPNHRRIPARFATHPDVIVRSTCPGDHEARRINA